MTPCNHDDLLDLARGGLSPERAEKVEEHAAACAECARELGWLRTERALFRTQTTTPAPHVWQGIERRLVVAREERRVRRQRWLQVGAGSTLVAAAAGFLFLIWGHGLSVKDDVASSANRDDTVEEPRPDNTIEAARAVVAAENEYRAAIRQLEEAYLDRREELDPEELLRFDSELRSLRNQLKAERVAAKDDVWARRRVLRTYSAYMRTMQAMVLPKPEVGQ
jgi:anti-sigma factor RsiW